MSAKGSPDEEAGEAVRKVRRAVDLPTTRPKGEWHARNSPAVPGGGRERRADAATAMPSSAFPARLLGGAWLSRDDFGTIS